MCRHHHCGTPKGRYRRTANVNVRENREEMRNAETLQINRPADERDESDRTNAVRKSVRREKQSSDETNETESRDLPFVLVAINRIVCYRNISSGAMHTLHRYAEQREVAAETCSSYAYRLYTFVHRDCCLFKKAAIFQTRFNNSVAAIYLYILSTKLIRFKME